MNGTWVIVWWNGYRYPVPAAEYTVSQVLTRFFRHHPDLSSPDLGLALFTMGGTEAEPDVLVCDGDEFVLRPRVVR